MKDYGISIIKWSNNSCVSLASTLFTKEPISRAAKRFSRKEMKKIVGQRPSTVEQYNKCIGGTDWMVQNVGYYRIGILLFKFFQS